MDTPLSPLEKQLGEIACEIAMEAETQLRELGAAQRAQRVRHNAWLAGEAQKRALERAARHTEVLKRAESARVTALLEAAEAFRKASEIRALVKGMRERLLASGAPLDQRFLDWTDWALAEADKATRVRKRPCREEPRTSRQRAKPNLITSLSETHAWDHKRAPNVPHDHRALGRLQPK